MILDFGDKKIINEENFSWSMKSRINKFYLINKKSLMFFHENEIKPYNENSSFVSKVIQTYSNSYEKNTTVWFLGISLNKFEYIWKLLNVSIIYKPVNINQTSPKLIFGRWSTYKPLRLSKYSTFRLLHCVDGARKVI